MDQIQIKDKTFALSIPESEILEAVRKVANQINTDLAGTNPLFICVLNGAFEPHRRLLNYRQSRGVVAKDFLISEEIAFFITNIYLLCSDFCSVHK